MLGLVGIVRISLWQYWPKAHDDEMRSFVELSLDTPLSALPQFVQEATRKLFAAFDGAKIPQATIEDATRRFFEKRR
jgi:hypothetical protein